MTSNHCIQCGNHSDAISEGGLCNACQCKLTVSSNHATIAYQDTSAATVRVAAVAPGRFVGDYELLSEVARGGMGVIYRARQISLNREVALKMVSANHYSNESAKERFRVEAEAVAALDHSNIIPIYEVGEYNGSPFYSMKLVGEGNLAEVLKKHDPVNGVESLVLLLEKICRAVQHAHERGVIHRDLKPSNILLEKRDQPMLADFGLAKLSGQDATLTGMILGTPRYMAPEQAAGQAKSATTRTDVYSLGVILYEILTGQSPYVGEDPLAVVMQVAEAKPLPPSSVVPSTDRSLEAICLKCLSKQPEDRYASAAALADDLAHWLAGEPISIRPPSTSRQVLEWLRKHSSSAIRLTLIGVLTGLLMSLSMMLIIMPSTMVSAEQSLEKHPSLPMPMLLRINWKWLRDLPAAVAICLPIFAIVSWILQGPLILLLLRPKDSASAMGLGFGCGTISGITACFCGVSQAFILALVIVPHIVVVRDVSIAALGSQKDRTEAQQRLHSRIPDIRNMPESEQGTAFLPYLVALQVVGAFEAIFLAALFVLLLGMTSVVGQTLIAYHLARRERAYLPWLLYYVECVIGFLLLIAYPLVLLFDAYSFISWLWWIVASTIAILGAIYQWRLILRLALYILCILGRELLDYSSDVESRLAGIVYLLLMAILTLQIIKSWKASRSKLAVHP